MLFGRFIVVKAQGFAGGDLDRPAAPSTSAVVLLSVPSDGSSKEDASLAILAGLIVRLLVRIALRLRFVAIGRRIKVDTSRRRRGEPAFLGAGVAGSLRQAAAQQGGSEEGHPQTGQQRREGASAHNQTQTINSPC